MTRLGIVAGGGGLPRRLVEACRSAGREVFVLALEGAAQPETVEGVAHAWCRLGAAARGLALLRQNNVRELVLAGGIARPSLIMLRPDWRAARLFARIGYKALGDDGLLSAVVSEFEREGFRVIGADQLLAAGDSGMDWRRRACSASGAPMPRRWPTSRTGSASRGHWARSTSARRSWCSRVWCSGVEAIEGTDALIRRCAGLRRDGPGGVLVKVEKPGQEQRADRPTIGPQTVTLAAEAGLSGIAVEAGATIVLDRDEVVDIADRAGLFVVGIRSA